MLNGSRMELSVLYHSIVRTEVQELNPRYGEQYYIRVKRTGAKKGSVKLSEACDTSAKTMHIGVVRIAIFLPTAHKLLACMCTL